MTSRSGSLNIALWIAAVPVALTALRLLAFARGDTTLLRVLLETMQVLPILIGTTLLILPWVVLMMLVVLVLNRSMRQPVMRWFIGRGMITGLAVLFLIVVIYMAPVGMAIAIAAATIVICFFTVIESLNKRWAKLVLRWANVMDNRDPFGAVVAVVVLPLLFNLLASWSSFWLPLEAVTQTGEKPVQGYVLSVTSEWTTLLTEDRAVVRLPSDTVDERLVCDQGTTVTFQTLTLHRDGALPKCPA